MLEIIDLYAAYDRVEVLKGVSFTVREGELVTLIGANGAGKSTILSAVMGLIPGVKGQGRFDGKDLLGKGTEEIVGMGLSMVPEDRGLFPPLTVLENLMLGAYLRLRKEKKAAIRADLEMIYELFPILKSRLKQPVGTLSGGQQQMVAIGRALMAKPKLLLLDEPSLGLAPLVVREIFKAVATLNQSGVTILLVEQNANLALKIAHRGYVVENGRIVLEGTAVELLTQEEVRKAYLGGGV